MNSLMPVAIHEAKHAINDSDTIEDQIRSAMAVTRHHWLVTDEEERFKSAVGAVMMHHGPESAVFQQLAWEIQADGSVTNVQVARSSGVSLLDLAAQRSVMSAAPFRPLPKDYETDHFTIQANFKPNP